MLNGLSTGIILGALGVGYFTNKNVEKFVDDGVKKLKEFNDKVNKSTLEHKEEEEE